MSDQTKEMKENVHSNRSRIFEEKASFKNKQDQPG